jgi:hypothetical protein
MNVKCIFVNTDGTPSVIYCPGRSDIEMNRKIRSVFHFYPHVFLTRALDYKSDVWHGKINQGEYNKISLGLLGKAVKGPLLIVTRNADADISSQKYVDTHWERITLFLSQTQEALQVTTIQKQQPKQEQQKQHIHIGVPSLNIISSNTSMGSSASVQEKAPVEVLVPQQPPESTERAYSGEGAFTYKPTPVEKKPPTVDVNITTSGALHVTVRDPGAPEGWYDDDEFVDIVPEESVTALVQDEEEEEKVVRSVRRGIAVRKQQAPVQPSAKRRSPRIAANQKKKKAKH